MSLEHKKKSYVITIRVYVYAPYSYTTRLMTKIGYYISRTVSREKLVDMVHDFKEVTKR